MGRYVHNWLERSITQGTQLISLQTADTKIFAAHIQRRDGVYPHPRWCGVLALYPRPRSCVILFCILSAAGRTGINPVPTADVCNTLAINGLSNWLQHTSTVVTMFASANALTCIRTCCFGFCVFHGFEITPFPWDFTFWDVNSAKKSRANRIIIVSLQR